MSLFGTVRAFAALNVEVLAVRRVLEAVEHLRAHPLAPPARWVAPTRMHVTLKFFGDIDAGLVPALRDALSALARDQPAPRLGFGSLGAFPSVEHARVLFAVVDDMGGDTARMAQAVEDGAAALGVVREARPFVPHMTIARTASPADVRSWIGSVAMEKVVGLAPELVLYRSDISRPGAEYEALARLALGPRRSVKTH
jgi:2'-5' RNA ligase